MGYFNFKKPVLASYLDQKNPPYMMGHSAMGSVQTLANMGTGSGMNFSQDRFNPQKDRIEEGSIVEDWIPRQPTMLHLLLRRIYLRDSIAGSVVDIFSTLPWGKIYELIGVDDPKILQMYHDMIEALGIWHDIQMISREKLIIGRMAASLPFNETTGMWDNLVPIDPDQLKLQPLPVSGRKPLMDVLSSPAWREFARSVDPRVLEIKETMNKDFMALLQNNSGYFPLDPMNTLFLARRVNQYDHIGTSLFSRILPAWAYEMALWNASLTGVRRRNRSILLVTAGIEETWEPNDNELSSLTSLFMEADEDPTGAIISVRQGVEVSEVRDPTAIWGISQEFEFLSTLKMRALGVSEAYLSGDVNVSTMEAARTSLGRSVSAFRDEMLREIFARQLFPTFARLHNFQKRTQAQLANKIRIAPSSNDAIRDYDRRMYENDRLDRWGYPIIAANQAVQLPLESLLMPRLITEDTMRPEQDIGYMELLEKLKDQGVPIPIRIWASAAGYDLDKAMAMMEEDVVLRKRLNQLLTEDQSGGGGGGGGGDSGDLFGGGEGGGEPPAEPPSKGGEKGGEEGASTEPGKSATLPPKWGFTTSAQVGDTPISRRMQELVGKSVSAETIRNADKTLQRLKNGQDPYVKMLSEQLDPRILADLQTPKGRELVPFISKDKELR